MIGGELTMALAEATGRAAAAGRLRALGPLPAGRRRAAGDGRAARPDRLGRSLPRPHRPRRGLRRGRARAPDLAHGRPDHDRLGDADEQGLRGDRGPPPLRRPLRADRGRRPPAVDRPLADRPQRRLLARPPRPARTCGCRSPTRSTTRSAPTSTCPRLDLAAAGELTFEEPDLETFACLRLALEAGEAGGRRPACSTPPTRSRSPPSSTGGSASRRSPRRSSAFWRRCPPVP